jgi:membrane protein
MNKTWFLFTEQLYCRFQDDDVSALSAQMTFYLILAFFPFLIFLLTIVSFTPVTSEHILGDIQHFLADDTYEIIETFVNDTLETGNTTLLSFGMIGTIWASSNGVMGILKGLNKAYDVEENRPFWKARGLAIIFTFALILVIILSFVLLVFGRAIGEMLFIFLLFPDHFDTIWGIIKYLIPLISMFIVFLFIYKIIPNRKLSIREVFPGAFFATLGWILTSALFAFYVNNFGNYSQVYGSIGGIIVLLLWLFISSLIILLGGEINAVLSFLRDGNLEMNCKKHKLNLPFVKKRSKDE